MKPTDQELIDYLLGDIAEPEQTRVEESLFSDDDSFERLSAIESRLVDLYVLDKLSPAERKLFEEKYRISPRRTANVAAATEFVHQLDTYRTRQRPKPLTTLMSRVRSFFETHNLALQGSLATVLVAVSIGSVWLFRERTRLKNQSQDLQAALSQREAELRALGANGSPNAAERAALERDRQELAQLEESLRQREEDLQSLEDRPSDRPTVATVILMPGIRSGSGDASPELVIRPRDKFVRLVATPEGELTESYRMVVQTVGGAVVRSRVVRRAPNAKTVTVTLPASLFNDRNYSVKVEALAPDDQVVDSDEYNLTVTRIN